MLYSPLLILICFLPSYFCVNEPEVETEYGRLRGFRYQLKNGEETNIYLGIPYAKPPIGYLRYERPMPPKKWTEILEVTKFGPSCPPHAASEILQPMDEDCLTLNIITPAEKCEDDRGYPVLFWIHGGGFEIGSASSHGYEGYANKYVSQDIIVVTIQYRLGPFGFFSTGDNVIPGNLGLWDQAAALKWTSQNIRAFGGDPSRITIWGLSAGGASVSLLSLSPYSRDLFSGAIEMSGSAWNSWAINERIVNNSLSLARTVGCSFDGPAIKECMKKKTVEQIHEAVKKIGPTAYDLSMLRFGPRIDGIFLPHHPNQLVKEGKPKRTILGMASKEALWFTTLGRSKSLCPFGIPINNQTSFGEPQLRQFIRKVVGERKYFGSRAEAAQKALIDKYVHEGKPANADHRFFLERYSKLLSDIQFTVGSIRGAEAKRNEGWPVHLYLFDHFNEEVFKNAPHVKGATHANEYPYIADIFILGKFDFTEADKIAGQTMVEAFVNFAKTGSPATEDQSWPVLSSQDPLQYLHVTGHPQMRSDLYQEERDFWQKMANEFGYDLIELPSENKPKKVRDEL